MAKSHDGYESLGAEDLAKIYAKLDEKGVKFKKCELCDTDDWNIAPVLTSPVVLKRNLLSGTLKPFDDSAINQISFSCGNCGNTKSLELHFLGIRLSKEADD